ncbi:MAG: AAA family ATPase [Patescibacteria group bacterium]
MSEEPQKDGNGMNRYLRRLMQPDEGRFKEEMEITDRDEGEVSKVSEDVQGKALSLLGLIEEYFSEGNPEAKEHLDWAEEEDLDQLLAKLEKSDGKSRDADDAKETIRGEIRLLLAVPDVKREFFRVLKTESQKFKAARPTLKKVARLSRLRAVIPRKVTTMYLKDKRERGKVQETTKKTIGALESKRERAETEIAQATATADSDTKSWLYVQELLGYKKELQEKGFATTESRRTLLSRVLSGVAHGEKIFLIGSTGTGKTQLATLVADLVNDEGYEIVSWHEGTTPRDLFGYREIDQAEGGMKSRTKPGPVSLAITNGKIVIHDEYTTGSTRAQLSAKAQLNARVGQKLHLPGFNGDVFEVKEGFGEIFTGNLKDDRTKAREDMDPAILRMLSGVKVGYMPSDELFKVVLAEMMDDTGFLPLSPQDVELIRRVTKAAELMQMCHDREIDGLNASANKEVIAQVFGGRMDEVHLDKSFLDTGTLTRMFEGWDLEKAKGRTFRQFLAEKLDRFLRDPKFDMDKQEKQLAGVILNVCGVLDAGGSGVIAPPLDKALWGEESREVILPSEVGRLFGVKPKADIDMDDEDEALGEAQERLLGLLNPSGRGREKPKEIEKQMEQQIQEALDIARLFEIGTGDAPAPTPEQIKQALKVVKKEQWEEVVKFKKPTLLIVPYPAKLDRYEKAINRPECKTPSSANDAYFSEFTKETFNLQCTQAKAGLTAPKGKALDDGKILGYRFVITDGVEDITDHGEWNQAKIGTKTPTNQERINAFNANFRPKSMMGLDDQSYALLQMRAMKSGAPIDKNTITLLEQVQRNGSVACGDWAGARAGFHNANLDFPLDSARLRASVMGEIKT